MRRLLQLFIRVVCTATFLSACTEPHRAECRWHPGTRRLPPDSLYWCGALPADSTYFYQP